jgi:flavodoxin
MPKEPNGTKILVSYFSHSGNTREIAQQIQRLTGGDLFEIVSVQPYPEDYDTVVEQAKKELGMAYRPQLKVLLESVAAYDTVFIGYPNWWNTFPMPVATFLRDNDFSGKTIAPFCTHEGSGLGRSVADVVKACRQAKVTRGLAIRGGSVKKAGDQVSRWIEEILNLKIQGAIL